MRLAGASGSARPKREPTSKETESAGLSETFLFSANLRWPLQGPHFRGRLGIAVGVEHHPAIADFDHIKTVRDGFLPLGNLHCLFPFHKGGPLARHVRSGSGALSSRLAEGSRWAGSLASQGGCNGSQSSPLPFSR